MVVEAMLSLSMCVDIESTLGSDEIAMDSLMVFIEEVISRDACDSRGVFPLVGEGKVVVWWENPPARWRGVGRPQDALLGRVKLRGRSTTACACRMVLAEPMLRRLPGLEEGASYGPRVSRGLRERVKV